MKPFLANVLLLQYALLTCSCQVAGASPDIEWVGCTPADAVIKTVLGISSGSSVDFIRWHLTLKNSATEPNAFILEFFYGEAQPNTLGFKGGGEKRLVEGYYTVTANGKNGILGEIYHLKSNELPGELSMVKLNDNLFHILTPQNQLMTGNGGWSYTLNRKDPILGQSGKLPALTAFSALSGDTAIQVVYDGRTPCQSFAAEHPEMNVSNDCFKLKWKLVLNRDSISHNPTTYTIRKVVDNLPRDISGNWAIIKLPESNPEVVIYKLDPDKPEASISFLVGDDNVLFFMNKQNELFTGNGDFSFTLNRRIPL